MRRPELLAPAGGKEALIAAVENGADAVYFGGSLFSARQYASNFTRDGLEWAIDYAHKRGVKAYVTVNTLIKDSELNKIGEYFQFLCSTGADAVIVQDLGILRLLREQLSELPVHASTQMTIHSIEGVKFLQEMGVKRVVLARELSLDEIRRIKSATAAEVEAFIHGALCFSYSGQCLLSSMIGGRSGNRGYCAQPCRKKYRAGEVEGYLLSPKDLNMSEHIGALVEAGIDSFKIEGRMKRPEYVAGVVRVYRKLIDRYFESPGNFQVSEEERHTLLQLFNRGFTTGYFFGNPGSELMSRRYPYNIGTELGRIIDYEPRKKLASISLEASLRTGDGIGIGESGVTIRSICIDNRKVTAARPGSVAKVRLEGETTAGDVVFKTHDSQLMASLAAKATRKIPVWILFRARVGEPAELCISDGENGIRAQGERVCRAENRPLSRESIAVQLKKLGNTVFGVQEVTFEIDDDIFIPVSLLNLLRRDAIARLEAARVQKWKRQCRSIEVRARPEKREPGIEPLLSVNTCSIGCLEAAVDSGADAVYIGGEALEKEDYSYAVEYGREKGTSVSIGIPRITKEFNLDADPDSFLVSDLGSLNYFRRQGKPVITDYSLNVFNRLTLAHLLNCSQRVTLSPELTLKEIGSLTPLGATECIVHGLFPLMVSEHDLAGGLGMRELCLRDERGFAFPVRTDAHGRTYIMNSRELCMLEYVPDIIQAGVNCLRIEAKTYDAKTTGKITRAYREALDNKSARRPCGGEYTTGHYQRGVL